MRKIETIKLDGKEIQVYELRVKDIRRLIEAGKNIDGGEQELAAALPLATSLAPEAVEELAPSELKLLWEAFQKVNADFLALLDRVGVATLVRDSIQKSLTEAFADSSSAATPAAGTTAGAAS